MTTRADLPLRGRRALVTGAGHNIGRAIAEALVEAGAVVFGTWASDRASVEEFCQWASGQGGEAYAVHLDLSDPASCSAAADEALGGGAVDILINSAAVRPQTRLAEVTLEEWDLVLNTNLRGAFLLAQRFIPGMREQGWGRIVSLSGLDAYWGKALRPHVVTSKLGLIGLSRALAGETARWGITVNCVIPGPIDTVRRRSDWHPDPENLYAELLSKVPMARLGKAEEVAGAVLYLCSDLAAYISGQELRVTGGGFPVVRHPSDEY